MAGIGHRGFMGRNKGGCPIEALDYIAAVEVHTTLTNGEKSAICQFVKDLMGIGSTPNNSNIWSYFAEFYPIITSNPSAQAIDLINLNTWTLAQGTFTHSSDGVEPATTSVSQIESNTSISAINDGGFDLWVDSDYSSPSASALRGINVGAGNGSTSRFSIKAKTNGGDLEYLAGDTASTGYRTVPNADGKGFYSITRDTANNMRYMAKNGVVVDSWSLPNTASGSQVINLFFGSSVSLPNPPPPVTQSMWGIRLLHINSTQIGDYYYAVNKFQTAFGRN